MTKEDAYDSLIKYYANDIFPEIDWRLIKAQIWQESKMDPRALSPARCMGLMQISLPLAKERLVHVNSVWCVDVNIRLGVTYLKEQRDRFQEIPIPEEKRAFALASYNCGRGYVNMALRLAREAENGNQKDRTPGKWQLWAYTNPFLEDPRCLVRGKRPDAPQVLGYVKHIIRRFRHYRDLDESYP